jgi:hypothetical protein
MKGDFSRDTFDPKKHFLRVMLQQGRVQLDADWNEQTSILLHYLQTLASDLIGPYGGPKENCGFKISDITIDPNNFNIGPAGRYYVNGLLCENEEQNTSFNGQKGYPFPDSLKHEDIKQNIQSKTAMMIFLDVWERHMAWYDEPKDTVPYMREVALDGPDTATRSQVVWQVKVNELVKNFNCDDGIKEIIGIHQPENRGLMRATTNQKANKKEKDYCIASPNSRYRGNENRLYRIEVHRPGIAHPGEADGATFKWSRDNGSVVFPILDGSISITENLMKATLSDLGKDDRSKLKIGNWMEFVHENYVLQNSHYPLLKVEGIDLSTMEVSLLWETEGAQPLLEKEEFEQPLLRRWDQTNKEGCKVEKYGDIYIIEKPKDNDTEKWFDLEDGIQIQFLQQTKGTVDTKHIYRTGDYWLIPSRTIGGDIEWPGLNRDAVPPHGIDHYYAPLAILSTVNDENGEQYKFTRCRNCFEYMKPPIE